jgi:hypothetical protein
MGGGRVGKAPGRAGGQEQSWPPRRSEPRVSDLFSQTLISAIPSALGTAWLLVAGSVPVGHGSRSGRTLEVLRCRLTSGGGEGREPWLSFRS